MKLMQPEKVLSFLREEIDKVKSPHQRSVLQSGFAGPIQQRRTFWTATGEAQGDLWLFFIIPRRKTVGLAYSDEGYGASGRSWGLVFVGSDFYGVTDSWYESLEGLLAENSLYFEKD